MASTNNLPTNITFWSLFATTGTANASNVTNTPAGNISATNVQNAINELDNEKANITQEAWISATLLNGWTGTLRYYKDSLGSIRVVGLISGGVTTGGTVIFNLPSGYRINSVGPAMRNIFVGTGVYRMGINHIGDCYLAQSIPAGTLSIDFSFRSDSNY